MKDCRIREMVRLFVKSRRDNQISIEAQAESLLDLLISELDVDLSKKYIDIALFEFINWLLLLLKKKYVGGNINDIFLDIHAYVKYILANNCFNDWDNCYYILYYLRLKYSLNDNEQSNKIIQEIIFSLNILHNSKARYGLNKNTINEVMCFHKLGLCPDLTSRLLNIRKSIVIFIPVRIDSAERLRNLHYVLMELSKINGVLIYLTEVDVSPKINIDSERYNIKYSFVYDSNKIFYRTKIINDFLYSSEHEIVGVWDADVICSLTQIYIAHELINNNDAVITYPYMGDFYFLDEHDSVNFKIDNINSCLNLKCYNQSVGGAFFVNRELYLKAGGENEFFYGWGPEDIERFTRLRILGFPIKRVEGNLYHLYHPRCINSGYINSKHENYSQSEYADICKMTAIELWRYINSWDRSLIHAKGLFWEQLYKANSELLFWKNEINQYIKWFRADISSLYNTRTPDLAEKILKDSLLDSSILTWANLHQFPKYISDLQLNPDTFRNLKVLDIGSGPIPSACCFTECDIYALDPLLDMYKNIGFPLHEFNVNYVVARAEEIPFPDNYFDAIISVNAIDHVDDLRMVASELKRVAKDNCLFAMHVHYHKATICEPIEICDRLFVDLFSWVNGLIVKNRSRSSFSLKVNDDEEFVLWTNII